jgi:uncharacterized damage-inducible protein DinB
MHTHAMFQRLFEHMAWADEEVGRALRARGGAHQDLVQLYAHLLGAELVWLDRVEGAPQSGAVWPELDLAGCGRLAELTRTRYARFVAGLNEPELERRVTYTNSAGATFTSQVADILLQVVLHGSSHRGQISRALRERTGQASPTDYIAFVRGAPAAVRSDAR